MLRCAIACVILTILPAGPAAAGVKNSPQLTQETRDAVQLTQQNIVKMKLKAVSQPPPLPDISVPPILPRYPPDKGAGQLNQRLSRGI
jgi:hypothetical protein